MWFFLAEIRHQVITPSHASCSVGQGDAVLFWKMTNNQIMHSTIPRLFLFKNEDVSVAHFCSTQDMDDLYPLPLSPKAFEELNQIQFVSSGILFRWLGTENTQDI